ncbi:Metal-dependent protein hydrolase [Spatholobus suberectus]|nr:Metal-dependent protein hydrolase [Spatholobus suberectus]
MFKLAAVWHKTFAFHKRWLVASCFSTRVGTHNGTFHCDEALACFMLRLSKRFSGAHIVRTRDPNLLASLHAVVDVGGVYDPRRHRFDHHQMGFHQVSGHGFATKLSSAGLVYKAIDAVDNGVNQCDLNDPPKYEINTSLSSRIKRLNLNWMDSDRSSDRENEAFHQAMTLAGAEFLENVNYYAKSWLPARSNVMESLAVRESVDSSGEIIKLNRSCPWKLHIHELEEEMKISPIKYVLYQDDRSENWRLQAVAISPARFESRKPLPNLWRGLESDKLSEVAGIPGCTFVHMGGFIGGNRSYGGALAMARASLKA